MEILDKIYLEEYEEFVGKHLNGNFMQSCNWAKVKNNWKSEYIVSTDKDGKIQGSMMVLIKKVPIFNRTFLYAPRGPVCDFHRFDIISDLMSGVEILTQKHKSYIFRMDPCVLASDTEFIKKIKKLGFKFKENMPDLSTVQVRNNYMLNINGKTSDQLFENFHSKWRYNIRLAEKKGVKCDYYNKNNVIEDKYLNDFYNLMEMTGKRDNFTIRPKEYFKRILNSFSEDNCRLYMCYKDDIALSGAVAIRYAGKTCYVYGASSNSLRNLMPNYLMQWKMIKWAADNNDRIYDFQGIPFYYDENDPHYGMYKFKKGFNGEVVQFAGEFDYVFSKKYFYIIKICEKIFCYAKKALKYLKTIFF